MKLLQLLESNKVDVVRIDVPLFIRLLEYAREDARDDMVLHSITERMISISQTRVCTMDDYDDIVGSR